MIIAKLYELIYQKISTIISDSNAYSTGQPKSMAYSFCEHYILAWGGNSYNNQMRIVRVEVGLLLLLLLVLEMVAAA